MDKETRTIVVIPTYNEAQNIERLIAEIFNFQPEIDILVVDDNSPDGTGKLVENLSKRSDKIRILHRQKKVGLGKAYIEGFSYVLSQQPPYDRIIQMDADFSHSPKYLSDLLSATEDKDLSIGSRYISHGKVVDWDLGRRLFSYIANLYVRLFLGLKIKDWTTGFRCFRREVLANIGLETIESKGYLFQIEVLNRCLQFGYSFKEMPITFIERKEGKTKLGFLEIWEAIWGVPRLSFNLFKIIGNKHIF